MVTDKLIKQSLCNLRNGFSKVTQDFLENGTSFQHFTVFVHYDQGQDYTLYTFVMFSSMSEVTQYLFYMVYWLRLLTFLIIQLYNKSY